MKPDLRFSFPGRRMVQSAGRLMGGVRCPRGGWVALAAAGALLAGGCKDDAVKGPAPLQTVQVMTVAATDFPVTAELIGQLDSPQNVEVRARVEAFVDKILFKEGTEVKQDDPLFELDRKPFEEQLAAAKGSLAEAKASLNKAEKDVARLKPLVDKRAVPQQDLDNAQASVEVGKASVLSAEARVQSAQLDLGYCDVRSPITGLIGAKQVSIGELVGKGQPTLLATISTLHPIWFYCALSEVEYLAAERRAKEHGRQVEELELELQLADGTMHTEKGRFVFRDRAVNTATATMRVRAEFPNPKKELRPGMFARLKVHVGVRKDSLLLPERAVLELQGKYFIWVIGEGDMARQQPVVVGAREGGQVLILEGLKAGERVVVEGLQKVRDGVAVKPATGEEMAKVAGAAKATADQAKAAAAAAQKAGGEPAKH